MLAGASRLRGHRSQSSRAVARALRDTALGRIPEAERAWIKRIDDYRPQLPLDAIGASPDARGRPESERLSEAREAVRWMSIPSLLGRLLTRMVGELGPRSCLELGTGFGLSAAYQAAALETRGAGKLTTLDIEGMATLARPGLARLQLLHRIDFLPGQIEDTLEAALELTAPIDYVLLDADHTEAGTMGAFDRISPHLAAGAVVVLDDVAWTQEMRRAWPAIKNRPGVEAAVTLKRLGIVIAAGAA